LTDLALIEYRTKETQQNNIQSSKTDIMNLVKMFVSNLELRFQVSNMFALKFINAECFLETFNEKNEMKILEHVVSS